MNNLINMSVSICKSFRLLLLKTKKLDYFSIGEKLTMVQNWFYGIKSSLEYECLILFAKLVVWEINFGSDHFRLVNCVPCTLKVFFLT